MKSVEFEKTFTKHYKQRIATNPSLVKQFDERYGLFILGVRDYPLYDHPLSGNMKGARAFSISGDIRIVYREGPDMYVFIDVGTHNQVY